MNIGVGSLFLLQGIFPARESNWGLLRYRWILYWLSYLLFYKLQEIKDRFFTALKGRMNIIQTCKCNRSEFECSIL